MRKVFPAVVVVLVVMIGLIVLAPQAPDGTWINETGEKISDGLRAFWGNPVTP